MLLREYKKHINDVKSIEDYNKLIKNLTDMEKRTFSLNIIDHIISEVDLTYFDFNNDKLNELLSFLILEYEESSYKTVLNNLTNKLFTNPLLNYSPFLFLFKNRKNDFQKQFVKKAFDTSLIRKKDKDNKDRNAYKVMDSSFIFFKQLIDENLEKINTFYFSTDNIIMKFFLIYGLESFDKNTYFDLKFLKTDKIINFDGLNNDEIVDLIENDIMHRSLHGHYFEFISNVHYAQKHQLYHDEENYPCLFNLENGNSLSIYNAYHEYTLNPNELKHRLSLVPIHNTNYVLPKEYEYSLLINLFLNESNFPNEYVYNQIIKNFIFNNKVNLIELNDLLKGKLNNSLLHNDTDNINFINLILDKFNNFIPQNINKKISI